MKRILAVLVALAMTVSLAAVSSVACAANSDTYTIAIVKQLDHASLDEIANAIAKELDLIAEEKLSPHR